jgi:hypothetical protein
MGGFSMKCNFVGRRIVARLTLGVAAVFPATQLTWAQQGYVPPQFAPAGGTYHQAAPIPAHMASPLAGGPSAAAGGQFMDVHGNAIVMPASFHGHPGSAYCPPGPADMCNYGDPMAVDFGGYGEDQIGPHYFDVSFGIVVLSPDAPLSKLGPFSSLGIGLAQPKFLDPSGSGEDFEPGWQVAVRYDLGPLSVIEATYMGMYDFNFSDSVVSTQVAPGGLDNQLFSVFSDFGIGTTNPALDFASVHTISYESDLQNTEISYRRYWVGNSPRVSGTYLLGARYLRMTENFNFFGSSTLDGSANVNFDSQNDLVGFQLGGDGWVGVLQGFRVGAEGKAGVYNNRFEFQTTQDAVVNAPGLLDADGNQVAFVADAGVNAVFDILPSWSVRCGYQALYINELVTVGNNINTDVLDPIATPPALNADGHAFYHGFNAGMEYIW